MNDPNDGAYWTTDPAYWNALQREHQLTDAEWEAKIDATTEAAKAEWFGPEG